MSGLADMRAALETAISAMSPALDTAWENVAFAPSPGVAYQRVEFMFARPANDEVSANYRQDGICQVTLCYPTNAGAAAIVARAELLKATFARGQSFSANATVTKVSDTPEAMAAYVDGDRFCVPVRIRVFAQL